MITVYFREAPSGGLHDFQSVAASTMRPFEIGAQRVSRPFRDAYGWVAGLFHAKSENERLHAGARGRERSQVILNAEAAARERAAPRPAAATGAVTTFPQDFPRDRAVAASVMSNPAGEFEQKIIIAAGSVRRHPASTTRSSPDAASSATSPRSCATSPGDDAHRPGERRHRARRQDRRDRHPRATVKDPPCSSTGPEAEEGPARTTSIVTAGRGPGAARLVLPERHPDRRGRVRRADRRRPLSRTCRCSPFVDFSDLDSVLVLVPKNR